MGVHCVGRPGDDFTFDRHDRFHTQAVERLERRQLRIRYDLRQPVMITKVNEEQVPVVALAMDPS